MKKIYLPFFVFVLFAVKPAQAQLTLTKAANEPALGDMITIMQYDSTTVVPKSIGTGQSWNFTTLSAASYTQATTYTTVASTPGGSLLFPTATLAAAEVSGSSTKYEYYQSTSTTFEYAGSSDPSSVTTMTFSNTGTLFKWPISYGSSNTDNFVATQTSTASSANITGTVSYVAAGAGTVTLPGGNQHLNCLQVIQSLSLTIISGTNTITQTQTEYMYFSSSVKLPILTAQYTSQTSGTVTTKSFEVEVNINALSTGINEPSLTANQVVLYPNPVKNAFSVKMPNDAVASSVEVVDVTGKVVAQQTGSNTVDVSTLPKAVYFARIKYNGSVIQKTFALTD